MSEPAIATLGGGCFWCLEAAFSRLTGVVAVTSGYSGGGDDAAPTYRSVCSGRSGHAEVVQVVFYPALIAYRELLEIFFAIHDPTSLNRQGNDVGSQYRSVTFTHSEEQRAIAAALIAELDGAALWPAAIVTEVAPAQRFYPAEREHQAYYQRNTQQAYCQFVIAPKLAKLRQAFATRLKTGC